MNNALILIDYTYDFVAPEGKLTAGEPAQAIDGSLVEAIEETLETGGKVFVVNDLHLEGDTTHPEAALFPPHNLAGTSGRNLYGETAKALENHRDLENKQIFYLDKFRYSAFYGTALDLLLRQYGIQNIELAGVCTDICVLHTAVSAYNLGYSVTVHAGRVASFNAQGHTWALEHMKTSLGFKILS